MDHLLRNGSPVYVDRRPLEADVLVVPEVPLRDGFHKPSPDGAPSIGPAGFHPHAYGRDGRRAPLALAINAIKSQNRGLIRFSTHLF